MICRISSGLIENERLSGMWDVRTWPSRSASPSRPGLSWHKRRHNTDRKEAVVFRKALRPSEVGHFVQLVLHKGALRWSSVVMETGELASWKPCWEDPTLLRTSDQALLTGKCALVLTSCRRVPSPPPTAETCLGSEVPVLPLLTSQRGWNELLALSLSWCSFFILKMLPLLPNTRL